MKTKNRLPALFMAVALVVAATAFASAPANYTLFLRNGALRIADNDAAEEHPGKGSTWSVSGNTLTLTDFTFETGGVTRGLLIPYGLTTTIVLNGTNTIKNAEASGPTDGIYVNQSDLTIKGDGSLTVTVVGTGAGGTNCGINISGSNTLTIESGTIVANALTTEGHNSGINTRKMIINGGTITATGGNTTGTNRNVTGIVGNLTINGGTVTATAGTAYRYSYGIGGDPQFTITIIGGIVTAIGNTRAIAFDYSVPNGQTVTVSENVDGTGSQPLAVGGTITSTHKWARIMTLSNDVPPTGLPDLTAAATWMYILIALSLGLWGYVGYGYISQRKLKRG